MKPAVRAELEALRYRAYGPSPDIADDPNALRRLAELEGWAEGPESEPSAPETTAPASTPPAEAATPEPADESPATAPESAEEPRQPRPPARAFLRVSLRRVPRIAWMAWGASLVAMATLAAVVTYGLVSIAPVAVSQGARQIATLEPDPTVRVPTGWFGAGASSVAYSFYGLTLFESTQGMYGTGGDCVTAVLASDVPPDDQTFENGYSITGPAFSGCRAGSFPATISFMVDSASPLELRAQFPGASLQFIKDDDRIGVFLGTSDAD